MEQIYKTKWGQYIDLSAIISISKTIKDESRAFPELNIEIDVQLREKPLIVIFSTTDYDSYDNYCKNAQGKTSDLIEAWKKYKESQAHVYYVASKDNKNVAYPCSETVTAIATEDIKTGQMVTYNYVSGHVSLYQKDKSFVEPNPPCETCENNKPHKKRIGCNKTFANESGINMFFQQYCKYSIESTVQISHPDGICVFSAKIIEFYTESKADYKPWQLVLDVSDSKYDEKWINKCIYEKLECDITLENGAKKKTYYGKGIVFVNKDNILEINGTNLMDI